MVSKGGYQRTSGVHIVQYYLGHISVEELQQRASEFLKFTANTEILTKPIFIYAKQKLNVGLVDEAAALFKLAMANQIYNFVEYRFAAFELMKLKPVQTEDEKRREKCGNKSDFLKINRTHRSLIERIEN